MSKRRFFSLHSLTNSFIFTELKKEENIEIVDYYADNGYSGTTFNRPEFKRMFNALVNGDINTVIVKDLSRFGRNYIEVGNYIEQIFPLYNIRFIAINDNVDSYKDPKSINNVIVPFKNLMNDEYARDISNKVRSVLMTKSLNGEWVGGTCPYGYKKNPENYKGSVAHACEIIRVAVTHRTMTPDLYEIMQVLGEKEVKSRIENKLK